MVLRLLAVVCLAAALCSAQTRTSGMTNLAGSTMDFSSATATRVVKVGTSDPGTCTVGDLLFRSDLTAGQNLKGCTSTNTWTLIGDGNSGGGGITEVANLAALPASCTRGEWRSVADQAIMNRLYYCSATNTWVRFGPITGDSGTVTFDTTTGKVDVNPSAIPTLVDDNEFAAIQAHTPSSAQVIDAVGDSISPDAGTVLIDPNANYTLTSAPTIADATNNGAFTKVCNIDAAFTVTIQDSGTLASSNISLGGVTTYGIAPNKCIELTWLSTTSRWHCLNCSAASSTTSTNFFWDNRGSMFGGTTGNQTVTQNAIKTYLFTVHGSAVVDKCGMNAASNTAAGNFKCAVYSMSGTTGTLLAATGDLAAAAATAAAINGSFTQQTLTTGQYVLAVASESASMTLVGIAASVSLTSMANNSSTIPVFGNAAETLDGSGLFPNTITVSASGGAQFFASVGK
jgi:hypothetical protein